MTDLTATAFFRQAAEEHQPVVYHATPRVKWPVPDDGVTWLHVGTEQSARDRMKSLDPKTEYSLRWEGHGGIPAEEATWKLHRSHMRGPLYPHVLSDEVANDLADYSTPGDAQRTNGVLRRHGYEHPADGYSAFKYTNVFEDKGSHSYLVRPNALHQHETIESHQPLIPKQATATAFFRQAADRKYYYHATNADLKPGDTLKPLSHLPQEDGSHESQWGHDFYKGEDAWRANKVWLFAHPHHARDYDPSMKIYKVQPENVQEHQHDPHDEESLDYGMDKQYHADSATVVGRVPKPSYDRFPPQIHRSSKTATAFFRQAAWSDDENLSDKTKQAVDQAEGDWHTHRQYLAEDHMNKHLVDEESNRLAHIGHAQRTADKVADAEGMPRIKVVDHPSDNVAGRGTAHDGTPVIALGYNTMKHTTLLHELTHHKRQPSGDDPDHNAGGFMGDYIGMLQRHHPDPKAWEHFMNSNKLAVNYMRNNPDKFPQRTKTATAFFRQAAAKDGDDIPSGLLNPHGHHVKVNTGGYSNVELVPRHEVLRYASQETDREHVKEVGTHVATSGSMEPLILHYHPKTSEAYLGEGNHRLRAARTLKMDHVPVRVERWNSGLPGPGVKTPQAHPAIAAGTHVPAEIKPSDLGFSTLDTQGHGGGMSATSFFRHAAEGYPEDSAKTQEGSYVRDAERTAGKGKPRHQPRAGDGAAGEGEDAAGAAPDGGGSEEESRAVTWHPAASKEMSKLAAPDQKQISATVDSLAANGHGPQTHTLNGRLKGWSATKASRGHRIVHRDMDDGTLHIGYVGLHDYDRAIKRLTSLQVSATAFFKQAADVDPGGDGEKPWWHHTRNWITHQHYLQQGETSGPHQSEHDPNDPFPKLHDMHRDGNFPEKTNERDATHALRAISEDHYQHALATGHLDTDGRGNIDQQEGNCAMVDTGNHVPNFYLPKDKPGRIVKIRLHREDGWETNPHDTYVKTQRPIPMDRIEDVSPPIGPGGRSQTTAAREHTVTEFFKQAAAETGTGIMVALVPPREIAEQMAQHGTEPAEQLHVTMAYLGKTADYTKEQLAWLPELVGSWAARQKPVSARVGGAGKFENGDEHVLWAAVDIPGGAQMHSSLAAFLTGHGYRLPSEHGWTPHLTLAYVGRHFRFLPKLDEHSWTSAEVWTVIGGKWNKATLGAGPR